jgi:hypothetical protein
LKNEILSLEGFSNGDQQADRRQRSQGGRAHSASRQSMGERTWTKRDKNKGARREKKAS